MKTALDGLIEELEAGTWRPAQDSPRRFAQTAERRSTPDSPTTPLPSRHEPDAVVACGSPHCAGWYEVAPGVKIHPPKSSEEWKEWLIRWEPQGKVQ
jgi:hypothetical protein